MRLNNKLPPDNNSSDEEEFYVIDDDSLHFDENDFNEETEQQTEELLMPFDVDRYLTKSPHDPTPTFQPTLSELSENEKADKVLEEFIRLKNSLAHTLEVISSTNQLEERNNILLEEPKIETNQNSKITEMVEVTDSGQTYLVPSSDLPKETASYVQLNINARPYSFNAPNEIPYTLTTDSTREYATTKSVENPYILVTPATSAYTNIIQSKSAYAEVEQGSVPYVITSSSIPQKVLNVAKPYCYAY
jgi:hypothetical protein